MADLVIIERSDIVAVADAVRNKIGSSNDLTIGEMVSGISSIASNGLDTSDADALADEIMIGKTAYVNGEKVTGTFSIENEIVSQDNIISQIQAALEGKAGGSDGVNIPELYTVNWSTNDTMVDIWYTGIDGNNDIKRMKVSGTSGTFQCMRGFIECSSNPVADSWGFDWYPIIQDVNIEAPYISAYGVDGSVFAVLISDNCDLVLTFETQGGGW